MEQMPIETSEFDLLGLWHTHDGRVAVATSLDDQGLLHGIVTRAGRTYDCTWDNDQNSIIPFRFIDDLAIKIEV
jgi:hypothetical protein